MAIFMSMRFVTLITNKMFIRAPKCMRKEAMALGMYLLTISY